MKKIYLLFLILFAFTTSVTVAQNSHDKISYQSVVRDGSNHLLYDTQVTVAVSIKNSGDPAVKYSETHTVTSNANGLISFLIGDGNSPSGNWDAIEWNRAEITMVTSVAGVVLSTHTLPLSAVPYALYAKNAGAASYADSVDINVVKHYVDQQGYLTEEVQVLSISNDTIFLTGGSWVKLPAGFSGDYNELTNVPTDLVHDANYVHTDNNYTDAEQTKLEGIEAGAEVNVQGDWTETDATKDSYIQHKPENLVQDPNYVHTDNNYTNAEKTKLEGIEAGAEVNVQGDWTETDATKDSYIQHKPENLVQDPNYVHTDNNYTNAEQTKLEGIEAGAEVNVQSDWSETDQSSDAFIQNKPTKLSQFSNDVPFLTQEVQALSISNDTIFLTGGTFVKLPAGFSGSYKDLVDTPTKVSNFQNDAGYLTSFTEQQVLSISNDTIFLTGGSFVKLPAGFSGSYKDLVDTPTRVSNFQNDAGYLTSFTEQQVLSISNDTIFLTGGSFVKLPVQAQSDWEQATTSAVDYIQNKPTKLSQFSNDVPFLTQEVQALSISNDTIFLTGGTFVKLPAGFSGSYKDLVDTPTKVSNFQNDAGYLTSFTEQQVLSISNDTIFLTGGSFVKLPAGFSGSYKDLVDTPTKVSNFQNDAGYLTSFTEQQVLSISNDTIFLTGGSFVKLPAQAQSDWEQATTSAVDYIKNKPTKLSQFSNDVPFLTQEVQALSISNDTIFLTGGGYVKLPAGFSGSYKDLVDTPTKVSNFQNDAGYLTSFTEQQILSISNDTIFLTGGSFVKLPVQAQSDWEQATTSAVDYIKNKPTKLSQFSNDVPFLTQEVQALSISNDTIFLTGGTFVKLPAGFSGSYKDLVDTPTKVSNFQNDAGYLTSFTEQQILSISNDTIFLTGGSFVKLPTGFSGSYKDLVDTPTRVSNFQNDAGYLTSFTEQQILSISNDTIFLTGGSYVKLPAQAQSDWDQATTSAVDFIKNKPTKLSQFSNDVPFLTQEVQALSISNDTIFLTGGTFVKLPAGFSGSYKDLVDTPTKVSNFQNDAGYLTSFTEQQILSISNDTIFLTGGSYVKLPAQTQSNWNQTDGNAADFIKNKPTINDVAINITTNGTSTGVTNGSFTLNQSEGQTINITVPTQTSELTNNSNLAYTTGNTFTGAHDFTASGTTITVSSNTDAIKRPIPTTSPASECTNMNAVNVCDLLAVFDSLSRRIDTLQKQLNELKSATPPSVSVNLSEVQYTSMKATATASGNGANITSYKFCISTNSDMSGATCFTNTSNEYTFTGLSANTVYYVTVDATNMAGTTTSDVVSKRTAMHAPTGTFSLQPIAPKGFTVTVSELNFQEPAAGTVQICYKKNDGTCPTDFSSYTTTCDAELNLTSNTTDTTRKILNVDEQADVEYCVMVKLTNGDSTTILGPSTVTTGIDVSIDIEGNSNVNLCGDESIQYTYRAVLSGDEATGYTYEWKVNDVLLEGRTNDTLNYTFSSTGTPTISCTATKDEISAVTSVDINVINEGNRPSFTLCDDYSSVTLKSLSDNLSFINWGDSSSSDNENSDPSEDDDHTYINSGVYTITATSTDGCTATKQVSMGVATLHLCSPGTHTAQVVGSGLVGFGLNNELVDGLESIDSENEGRIVSVKDYDGNEYPVVEIGGLCWTKTNLRTTHFSGGESINQGYLENQPYYYSDGDNGNSYGYYYSVLAALNGTSGSNEIIGALQGICPKGWHIPSMEEWVVLQQVNDGGVCHAGGCYWDDDSDSDEDYTYPGNYLHPLRNITGFSALPAGYYLDGDLDEYEVGGYSYFWSSTKNNNGSFICPSINENTIEAYETYTVNNNNTGYSVRCVRDTTMEVPVSLSLTSTSDTVALNGTVTYTASISGVDDLSEFNYEWKVSNTIEQEGTSESFSFTHNSGGVRTITCIAKKGAIELQASITTTVIGLHVIPDPSGDIVFCVGDSKTVTFTATPSIGLTELDPDDYDFEWHDGSTGQTFTYTFNDAGSQTVSCTATLRESGFAVSGQRTVSATTIPVPSFAISECVYNQINTVKMGNASNVAKVIWEEGGEEENYSSGMTHLYTLNSGVFSITAKSSAGCTTTKQIALGHATLHPCEVGSARDNEMGPTTGTTIDSLVDAAGNWYGVVQIGSQCWMKNNLRTTVYPNGTTSIPDGTNPSGNHPTMSSSSPYCYNPNLAPDRKSNTFVGYYSEDIHGLYYNWDAVMGGSEGYDGTSDVQGICPNGWHVPSLSEWNILRDYVENAEGAIADNSADHNKYAYLMTVCSWTQTTPSSSGRAGYLSVFTNSTGFSAFSTGYAHNDGQASKLFYEKNNNNPSVSRFWSSNAGGTEGTASYVLLNSNNSDLGEGTSSQKYGYSVRCIRSAETNSGVSLNVTSSGGTNQTICKGTPEVVTYTATPSDNNISGYTYVWSYGTGTLVSQSGNTCTISYSTEGHHSVICRATPNGGGGKISGIGAVYLALKGHNPSLTFCENGKVLNINTLSDVATIDWGDGSTDPSPSTSSSHEYTSSGVYSIIATSEAGCPITKQVAIGNATLYPCTVTSKRTNEGGSQTVIDSLQDIDGNWYGVVQIGSQCWMKSNLRTTRYSNGDQISYGTIDTGNKLSNDIAYYYRPTNQAQCTDNYYDYSKYDFNTYGLYYNWAATMHGAESSEAVPSGVQGVCPEGWHVPSDGEWNILINYVKNIPGATYYDYHSIGYIYVMTSSCDWKEHVGEPCGEPGEYVLPLRNISGFSVMPVGEARSHFWDNIALLPVATQSASFWTSTYADQFANSPRAYYHIIHHGNTSISSDNKCYTTYGNSVRCVRDVD